MNAKKAIAVLLTLAMLFRQRAARCGAAEESRTLPSRCQRKWIRSIPFRPGWRCLLNCCC